jgi:hypothetical protein
LFSLISLPLAYGWWRYRASGIETSDFGITQRTLFGRRRILWLAISDYKTKDGVYYVYGKDKTPVVFWSAINQLEELKAEIERRSPTPQTGWGKAPVKDSQVFQK